MLQIVENGQNSQPRTNKVRKKGYYMPQINYKLETNLSIQAT